MILTCPECATSFFVDDDRIPPVGRMVKCSSCGARWKALPEGEREPEPEASPADALAAISTPDETALDVAAPDDEIEFVPAARPAKKPKAAAKPKGGARGPIVGVVLIGLVAAAGGAVVVMREQVAGLVPGAAPLFAAIGLPVNEIGLAFEGVTWKPAFVGGRPVMAVTGAIRNTTHKAIVSPAVRVSLLDEAKSALVTYELTVTNGRVPPGGLRHFAWNLPDPPAGARGLEIRFNPAAKGAPPAPDAASAAAPVDAQPLAADSPDALPHHE